MKKKIFALVLLGILVLSTFLIGCGSKKSQDDEKVQKINYKVQYHDIALGENEFMVAEEVVGDSLYMLKQKYFPDTQTVNLELQKMMLADYSITTYPIDVDASFIVMGMSVGKDSIWMATQYTKWDDNYEKMLEAAYKLVCCDLEGNVLCTLDISGDIKEKGTQEEPAYIASIAVDKDGNVIVTNCESFIIAYDKDGNKVADMEKDGFGNGLVKGEDGNVYYSYIDSVSWKQVLAVVDVKEQKTEENSVDLEIYNTYNMYIDAQSKVWMTDVNTLVAYDMNTQKKTEVLNWLDYDINGDNISFFRTLENGKYLAIIEDYTAETISLEMVTLEETDEVAEDKTIIKYATYGTDSDVTEAIIRFNKNNDTYRIEVVDYADFNNYEESFSKYNQAILDGSAADIFSVQYSQYKPYARKGLYADIGKMMNNDSDVNRQDYFENVLNAYEVEGKLYAMPLSFGVSTMVGKSSVWGDEPGVDMQKMQSVIQNAPNDVVLLDYITKEFWLYVALMGTIENYVNWETGECFFDSEEFITLLEIGNTFPDEITDEEESNTQEKIKNGKVLLENGYYYEIAEYQMTKALFDDEITVVGYPGTPGNGGLIESTGTVLAISEQSSQKEGAWEFIKYMISEEYQSNYISYDNPIHKTAFDKKLEEASKAEYMTNLDGEQVEVPKLTFGFDDNAEINIYHATEEDIQAYREIIEGATVLSSYDEEIMKIIKEETAPFFAGQKSAKDVAKIVQSKVKIYVNENR